jgi:hypothetical protein
MYVLRVQGVLGWRLATGSKKRRRCSRMLPLRRLLLRLHSA